MASFNSTSAHRAIQTRKETEPDPLPGFKQYLDQLTDRFENRVLVVHQDGNAKLYRLPETSSKK